MGVQGSPRLLRDPMLLQAVVLRLPDCTIFPRRGRTADGHQHRLWEVSG